MAAGESATQPAKPPARIVLINYRDGAGVECHAERHLKFAKGFGYYVRWNKRYILVDPLATSITV